MDPVKETPHNIENDNAKRKESIRHASVATNSGAQQEHTLSDRSARLSRTLWNLLWPGDGVPDLWAVAGGFE